MNASSEKEISESREDENITPTRGRPRASVPVKNAAQRMREYRQRIKENRNRNSEQKLLPNDNINTNRTEPMYANEPSLNKDPVIIAGPSCVNKPSTSSGINHNQSAKNIEQLNNEDHGDVINMLLPLQYKNNRSHEESATKGKEISSTERKIIVDLRNNGNSFRQIGNIIGRKHSSVQRVLKNYNTGGILSARSRSGLLSKCSTKGTQSLGNNTMQNLEITDRSALKKFNRHSEQRKSTVTTAAGWDRKPESYDYTQPNISADCEFYASNINPTETSHKRRMSMPNRSLPTSNSQRDSVDNNNHFRMHPDETSLNGYYEEERNYHCTFDTDMDSDGYLGQELVTKIEISDETLQNYEIHHNSLTAVKTEPEETLVDETLQNYEIHHNSLTAFKTEPEETLVDETLQNYEIHHNSLTAFKTEPEETLVDETLQNYEIHHNSLTAFKTEPEEMSVDEDLVKIPTNGNEWETLSASNSTTLVCKKESIEDYDLLREENMAENLNEQQWTSQFEKCEVRIKNVHSTSNICVEVKKEKVDGHLDSRVEDKYLETFETSSSHSTNLDSVNPLEHEHLASDQALQCPIPSFDAAKIQRFFQARNQGVRLKRREISIIERKLIVDLRKQGKSFREIGETIGRTHSCIQRVLKAYDPKGTLSVPVGRPSKLDTKESQILITTITQNPRITAAELVQMIQQKFGKKIHVDTVRKMLRKYNCRNSYK